MKKYIIIIILIILPLFYLNYKNTNKEILLKDNLVLKQIEINKNITSKGYNITNPKVILNPYEISPLTALIIFETEEEVAPEVTITGKDDKTTITHTFEKNKKHYLPIYGLYPDKNNKVIISYNNVKKTIYIKTDKLPENIAKVTYLYANKDKLGNELYFFTPSSKGYTSAYDINGDVRWYLNINSVWKIDKLKNGRLMLSTERMLNPPYYTTGLYEMDLLGKIYNEYTLKGGYHHDYFEMENGNLLVSTDDFNGDTVEDIIVEIDRNTGKEIKRIDLKNILNMEDAKSEGWVDYDWFHNNSVWFDKKTNSITLSGRHQDAVINIDYDTGNLNWIIGDNTNWSKDYLKYFFKPTGDLEWQWSQHAAMITPEGYVFILDNGNNKSKIKEEYVKAKDSYTRGVMYEIDTNKMEIKQIWQYGKERGSSFYSPYISDVDYINKNHYIVHSGGIVYKDGQIQNTPAGLIGADKLVSDTVELLNDEIIFEIKLNTNNYRVEKMNLYGNDTYEKNAPKTLGSFEKTKIDKRKLTLKLSNNSLDEEIKITNEGDRISISGVFKREDKVKVLLYKNLTLKEYDIRVSKKPYTALCVDIFTEEETEEGINVTKYINKKGLNGKYSIYIKINNKIYNSGKVVNFNE